MQLEAFMWHPYSAVFCPTTGHFKLNDATALKDRLSPMQIILPPRHLPIPEEVDVLSLVTMWTKSMQFDMRVENHIVICQVLQV
jgi:hypothetical protein